MVKRVVKDADIVLFVLDARMPDLSYNKSLERMLKLHDKEFVRVFTKIDLISKEELSKLRQSFNHSYFVSGLKNIGLSKLKSGLMMMGKRKGRKEPMIGVVGYPNMGKSAIINALAKRSKAKVSARAGTTKGIQWINAGSLRILDSPGVVPLKDREIALGLLGAKNVEKMKKPERVAFSIINRFVDAGNKGLEEFYGFEIEKGDDEYDILVRIGEAKGLLVKGGKIDENRVIEKVVRDWQTGKLKL